MTATEGGSGAGDVAPFLAKWRAREPEMGFAAVFVPRTMRASFDLWGALLFELREAAFELSDARVIEAKSGWWAEELLRAAQSAPRHPLTRALAAPSLPWPGLARGLLAVAHGDGGRPMDASAALAGVVPLGDGIVACEEALFGRAMKPSDAPGPTDAARAVAVHLQSERLRPRGGPPDGSGVPLALLARHGVQGAALGGEDGLPVLADWAGELASMLSEPLRGLVPYRRARVAFDRWLLDERAAGRERNDVPALRALRLAWRSARADRSSV